ncbi:MAG: hypothetical protein II008_15230 [Oscillospiraceae bacterium]|nr:hypothetical protein [Oscillospiraceae bacterium]
MNTMIPIEEAIQANNKTIGVCLLAFVFLSFVAWVFTIRRERRMKKRIKKAVAKAVQGTHSEWHDKALENFMHWMDCRIELKKTKAELHELRKKYDLLHQAAEGCPGVTRAKIIEN